MYWETKVTDYLDHVVRVTNRWQRPNRSCIVHQGVHPRVVGVAGLGHQTLSMEW